MPTPPTLVTSDNTAGWTTTTSPKTTGSLSVQTGDVLVVVAVGETQAQTLDTPTGGGLTYTLQRSVVATNYTSLYLWTATATSNTSITVSVARTGGTGRWGLHASVWRGSDGVGNTAVTNTTGAPSLSLTTGTANSAALVVVGDWQAVDGSSRTWRTSDSVTPSAGNGLELVYNLDSGRDTVYVGYWSDTASAGSKTLGLSAPGSQQYAIAGVEIKGAAGSGTSASAESASFSIASNAPMVTVAPSAESTSVTVTAYDATVSTGSSANASAESAAVTLAANAATVTAGAAAGGASLTVAAYDATVTGDVFGPFLFPGVALGIHVYIAPDADRTADPDTYFWIDVTEYVMSRGDEVAIRITRGATSEISQAPVTQAMFELNNRDGRFSSRNYNGPYWPDLKVGTPVRITVEDGPIESVRFTGRMDELPTRWDVSGRDIWVPVTASGIRRRLLSRPVTVPSAQESASTSAAGYLSAWLCTDRRFSFYAAEASGGYPLYPSGTVTWAAVVGPDGVSRLPDLSQGGLLSGYARSTATTDEWTVEASIKINNTSPSSLIIPLSIASEGDIPEWRLEANEVDGSTDLRIVDDGSEQVIINSALWLRDNHWHSVSLRVEQVGADVAVDLYIDGASVGTSTISATTMGRVTQVTLGDGQGLAGMVSAGYARVLTTADPADTGDADEGYLGETVNDRFTRLSAAAGVQYEVFGDANALMGPQSDEDLLGQLVECEAVDGGILAESREGRVALYARSLVYDAAVALTLDVDAGEVAPPFEADDSTTAMYNIASASMSRDDMSLTRTVRDDDHIDEFQEYEAPSQSLNAYLPAQLIAAAGDRVWQGTQSTYRYPRLVIDLARNPHLAATVVDLDIYDRLQVTNPPQPLVEDPDVVLIGYVEELGAYCWRLSTSTIRYAPFDARETSDGSGTAGWLMPDSLVTAESLDSTETAIDVSAIPQLPTGASHYPIDIRIDAEVMTVTACSGVGATQTLTVTRGVSGLQATHALGAEVEILTALILTR